MNSTITTIRKRPSECQPDELDAFKSIVLAGGQVQEVGLGTLIQTAEWIGFGFREGALVSVAAIKNPRTDYRKVVFEKAESKEHAEQFPLEYGWAHTLEGNEEQGLGSTLADTLLEGICSPLYATTGAANAVMQHILTKRGFEISGQPYRGHKEPKVLLVREAR
jgi:hypothetical protein